MENHPFIIYIWLTFHSYVKCKLPESTSLWTWLHMGSENRLLPKLMLDHHWAHLFGHCGVSPIQQTNPYGKPNRDSRHPAESQDWGMLSRPRQLGGLSLCQMFGKCVRVTLGSSNFGDGKPNHKCPLLQETLKWGGFLHSPSFCWNNWNTIRIQTSDMLLIVAPPLGRNSCEKSCSPCPGYLVSLKDIPAMWSLVIAGNTRTRV